MKGVVGNLRYADFQNISVYIDTNVYDLQVSYYWFYNTGCWERPDVNTAGKDTWQCHNIVFLLCLYPIEINNNNKVNK